MKTSFRLVFAAAIAAVLMFALAVPAFAAGSARLRTWGEVGFLFDAKKAAAAFDVRAIGEPAPGEEHAPASGRFAFKTSGLTYVATIEHIHGHTATEVHFGGTIAKSSNPSLVGKFVHVAVVDAGSPGRAGDTIAVVVSDTDMHEHGTPNAVTEGNLAVSSAR